MKCGVYTRVSSEGQRENWSIKVQRELGKEYAEANNYEWDLFDEVGSAKDITNRPEFSRLINEIQSGKINCVWVIEFTRLTRDDEDAAFFRKLCIEFNVKVIVKDEEIKFITPEDELFFTIRSSVSKYERRKLTERIKRANAQKMNSGKWRHTHQYGFNRLNDGTTDINEEQAEVVRLVFSLYNQGLGYPSIVDLLNKRGFKRFRGGTEWHISQVRNFILNPVFIGKTRDTDGNLITSKVYPPIISEEEWKLAQYRINHTYETNKKPEKRVSKYELSGLLKCSHCGHKFFFQTGKKRGDYYRHSRHCLAAKNCTAPTHIPKLIERIVMAVFMETFDRYENIEQIRNAFEPATLEDKNPIVVKKLTIELSELKDKKERLIDFIMDGSISKQDVKKRLSELDKEIGKIEAKIDSEAAKNSAKEGISEIERVLREYGEYILFNIWDMTPAERKVVYKAIIKEIQVDTETFIITVLFFDDKGYSLNYKNPSESWQGAIDVVEEYYKP